MTNSTVALGSMLNHGIDQYKFLEQCGSEIVEEGNRDVKWLIDSPNPIASLSKFVPSITSETLSKHSSSVLAKQVCSIFEKTLEPVCKDSEWSYERLQWTLGSKLTATLDTISKVGSSFWKTSQELYHEYNIHNRLRVMSMTTCFITGTFCSIKAVHELYEAVGSEKPKEHLLTALKLGFVSSASFLTGYAIFNS